MSFTLEESTEYVRHSFFVKVITNLIMTFDQAEIDEHIQELFKSQHDFYKLISDEENPNAIVMLRILQQFGFVKFSEFNFYYKRLIMKVESVSEWKNRTGNQFDETHSLIKCLDFISKMINANPNILNKNIGYNLHKPTTLSTICISLYKN